MRRIIVSEMMSVDGFFAGPNGELDWHNVDNEFNKYAADMLSKADLLLFGRVTYELMSGYWPLSKSSKEEPKVIADYMNNLSKVVFSKSLKKADWKNTKLVSDIVPRDILKMKSEPGKDILILGSGIIVSSFAKLGLIDEYRLIVNPVVLVYGKPLFRGMERLNLELLKTKTLKSGNVILYYKPKVK